MNTTTRTSELTFTVPTEELILGVLGSGYLMHEWWVNAYFNEDFDEDKLPELDTTPFIRLTITDPDNEDDTVIEWLTINDIVQGVNAIMKQCPWVRWDDLDANDADSVLQHAVLGKVVYG
jgi:hypothetical protein